MAVRLVCVAVLLPGVLGSTLCAQSTQSGVTVGAGVLIADKGRDDILARRGFTLFARHHWRGSPLLLEASIQHMPQNKEILSICPPFPAPCPRNVTGPTTALTFAPALQVSERNTRPSGAVVQVRVGPSISWHARREAESTPLALGARAGMSAKLGKQSGGVLFSGDVYRLFHDGSSPRWFVALTIGAVL